MQKLLVRSATSRLRASLMESDATGSRLPSMVSEVNDILDSTASPKDDSASTDCLHGTEVGAASDTRASNGSHSPDGQPRPGHGKSRRTNWTKQEPKRQKRGFGDQVEESHESKRQKLKEPENQNGRAKKGEDERPSHMNIAFSAEEIAAEERKPKRKVAVLIGYAGTGYHGMQINHEDRTIEGDLFAAFVAAGAISKANASDPKKSSLVRCARTDKGVHAAGNVISLKLIIEDEKVVQKINDNLPPQIRVWGILRTSNPFSCYQSCDSRWYEYLIPSYALLPPHPNSYLGRELERSAREKGTYDEMASRLDDVRDFWDAVEQDEIKPLLAALDADAREAVVAMMRATNEVKAYGRASLVDTEHKPAASEENGAGIGGGREEEEEEEEEEEGGGGGGGGEGGTDSPRATTSEPNGDAAGEKVSGRRGAAEGALRDIKAAYLTAKRRYRITPLRLEKLQAALDVYCGTHNFHNYTVDKSYNDASAKRHIKSFIANTQPVLIRDTEWLSLKVHGQSFMMHQIRKMVAMAAMVVRCGASPDVIAHSYGKRKISIPKAPSLGLLLERPVFDVYNYRAVNSLGRDAIDFAKYDDQIRAFKDAEIYARMWADEETRNIFHLYFQQLDSFQTDYFLWATAGGIEAAYERTGLGEVRMPKEWEAQGLADGEDEKAEEGDG